MDFKIVSNIFIALSMSSSIYAGVMVSNTRVIYPENQKSVNVQLINPIETPALVQFWIDDGNPKEIPNADKIPFIITPPLTRIDEKTGQTIRVIAKPNLLLPKDRESLYWFNMLDVAPTNKADSDKNLLQFSVRSRLKLFYRPNELKMSQTDAFKSVKFKLLNENHSDIEVENPTPYYITFNNFIFKNRDGSVLKYNSDIMLAPNTHKIIPNFKANKNIENVTYFVINDIGAKLPFDKKIEG